MFRAGAPLEMPREQTTAPRNRGASLLIFTVLLGVLWLNLNTGIDKSLADFYTVLMIIGALGYLFVIKEDKKFEQALRSIKLASFIRAYVALSLFTVAAFMVGSIMWFGNLNTANAFAGSWANFLATTLFIIAPVETLVFQFVMPKIITVALATEDNRKTQIYGGLIAQVSFGLFHFKTYGGDIASPFSGTVIASMVVAIVLGVVFYWVVVQFPTWGLGGAMGLHAGWNISVVLFQLVILGSILGGMPVG
jgi:hypothetical protein